MGIASVELGVSLAGRAAKYGRIVHLDVTHPATRGPGSDGNAAVPMIVGTRVVGVIELADGEWSEEGEELLAILASQAANAIESARLHHIAEQEGQTDARTRLYNRRRLDEDLAAEVQPTAATRRRT
jgi:GAF domain-containing protein